MNDSIFWPRMRAFIFSLQRVLWRRFVKRLKLKTLYSKASEKTNHGCRCYRTLGDSCGVEMSPLALLLFIGT